MDVEDGGFVAADDGVLDGRVVAGVCIDSRHLTDGLRHVAVYRMIFRYVDVIDPLGEHRHVVVFVDQVHDHCGVRTQPLARRRIV